LVKPTPSNVLGCWGGSTFGFYFSPKIIARRQSVTLYRLVWKECTYPDSLTPTKLARFFISFYHDLAPLKRYVSLVCIMEDAMKTKKARVFWTGRSQAVRLPKEFRFETDTVLVHRQGRAVVMTPAHEWSEGYAESFTGIERTSLR
jgi:virulence-associated protein VagC